MTFTMADTGLSRLKSQSMPSFTSVVITKFLIPDITISLKLRKLSATIFQSAEGPLVTSSFMISKPFSSFSITPCAGG